LRYGSINPEKLKALVQAHTEKRQWGFSGESQINGLKLNQTLENRH